MTILTVVFDPVDGGSLPDGTQEKWANDIIAIVNMAEEHEKYNFVVSNFDIVNYFRLAIAQGALSHEKFELIFQSKVVPVNEYGAISKWPKDMDYGLVVQRILQAQCAKRNKEKSNVKS